jgi:hypothetical protein
MFFRICKFLSEIYQELLKDRLASHRTYTHEQEIYVDVSPFEEELRLRGLSNGIRLLADKSYPPIVVNSYHRSTRQLPIVHRYSDCR